MTFQPIISKNSHFSFENIPFGVISSTNNPHPRCATAVGEHALDLDALSQLKFFKDNAVNEALSKPALNDFAALPAETRTKARAQIIEALKSNSIPESCAIPLQEVKMHLPMEIKEYTDFYCSLEHCQNCSAMMGGKIPENVLIHPSAYNGRASSVLPSPQLVRRPQGVYWSNNDPSTRKPVHGACQKLDYELEMGYFIAKPVPYDVLLQNPAEAREHIFGFVLLNDWSARDIQLFEMPPLGPLHSKAFATTISPWIITLDALEPFICPPKHRTSPLFEYLQYPAAGHEGNGITFEKGTFSIKLSAGLVRGGKEHRLCTSNMRYLYWTPDQQLSHHTSSGCGIRTGDVMGTGTISGDALDEKGEKKELACLFEATLGGSQPQTLRSEDGAELSVRYLEDGDEVIIRGWCGGDEEGDVKLGFGECRGRILPAGKGKL